MTVKNLPNYEPALAQKQGQDVFEILLPNWGMIDVALDYQNVVYPDLVSAAMGESFPVSMAALAIGPRSTVDRAWVTYSIEKAPIGNVNLVTVTDRVRRLSVGSPLGFTQSAKSGKARLQSVGGPPSAFYTQYDKGMLYVFAAANPQVTELEPYDNLFPDLQETTVLPLGTIRKADGTEQLFGPEAGINVFMPPLLHLVAYLKAPTVALPTERFPLQASKLVTLDGLAASEECIAQIPVFGRKHIRVDLSGVTTGVGNNVTLRCAIVRAVNQNVNNCFEGSSVTATAATGSVSVAYDNPCGDYLMVYVNGVSDDPIDLALAVAAYD